MGRINKPTRLFPYFALAGLGLLIYSNTFHASFHLDDLDAIVKNSAIRDLFDLKAIWNAFNTRFVVGLSLALNYRLGKLDVLGYHAFNITSHVLAAALVYRFTSLTLETQPLSGEAIQKHKIKISLFSSLVFLAHPIQTQAVTYIWQRATCLAAVFYLSSLVFYALARVRRSLSLYLASILCAGLGMFTKETTITLPLIIALYEFFFLGYLEKSTKKRILFILPFLLMLSVIPLTLTRAGEITLPLMKPTIAKLSQPSAPVSLNLMDVTRFVDEKQMPFQDYTLTQINVLRTYLGLLVLPVRQNLDYDYPLTRSLWNTPTLLSLALLILILFAGVRLYPKHRLAAFGIFWFFLTLSAESLIPQNDLIFEHRLYLPMMGYGLFLAYGLFIFMGRLKQKTLILTAILLAGIYSLLTYQRNFVWKDEGALWSDVVQKSPKKARGYNGRGNAYHAEGHLDEAISDFNKAIEIQPDFAKAHYNRGVAYQDKGLLNQAIQDYSQAIEINPDFADAYNNRGSVYQLKGVLDEAIRDYNKAIEIQPDFAVARHNRDVILRRVE